MPNRIKILTTIANEDAALIKLGEAAGGDEMFSTETVRRIVFGGESTIKVVRELRGLSQRELAKQVKSSSAYISQIENGRTAGRVMLSKLSKALSVPIDLLLNE